MDTQTTTTEKEQNVTEASYGQKVLDFIEQEFEKYKLPRSAVGILTTYMMVAPEIRPGMTKGQVEKLYDRRAKDIDAVIERRLNHSIDNISSKHDTTPYEKGARQGLANLRGVK